MSTIANIRGIVANTLIQALPTGGVSDAQRPRSGAADTPCWRVGFHFLDGPNS